MSVTTQICRAAQQTNTTDGEESEWEESTERGGLSCLSFVRGRGKKHAPHEL